MVWRFANTLRVCECTNAGSCRDKPPVRSTGDRASHAKQLPGSANTRTWYDETRDTRAIAISIRPDPYWETWRQLRFAVSYLNNETGRDIARSTQLLLATNEIRSRLHINNIIGGYGMWLNINKLIQNR